MQSSCSQAEMERRLVRFGELVPCRDAFVDRRIDGREGNENFTIIGPGVAESPEQHVHITIPHGFNVGGARQLPNAVNSQHSHETAEVFVVHSGRWAFRLGHDAGDGECVLAPGDTISIPTGVFRGFENVSEETGFVFAVLGGDDPGRVTWAPEVFEKARDTGLVLLENGQLVDRTKGEEIPAGVAPMTPITMDDVARFRCLKAEDLAECVLREAELAAASGSCLTAGTPVSECPIIGGASEAEGIPAGKMDWQHGFSVRALDFPPGSAIGSHRRTEEEVIFVHAGQLSVEWDEGAVDLGAGDTLSVPIGLARRFANPGATPTRAYVVRRGDRPAAPEFV